MDNNAILAFVSGVVVTRHGRPVITPANGARVNEQHAEATEAAREIFLHACRSLWFELHIVENPTPEWFRQWCATVKILLGGCDCSDWLGVYVVTNPPRYEDFFEWSVELHNAVNLKLKPAKPLMSVAFARQLYEKVSE